MTKKSYQSLKEKMLNRLHWPIPGITAARISAIIIPVNVAVHIVHLPGLKRSLTYHLYPC